jgi:hypothetical protein
VIAGVAPGAANPLASAGRLAWYVGFILAMTVAAEPWLAGPLSRRRARPTPVTPATVGILRLGWMLLLEAGCLRIIVAAADTQSTVTGVPFFHGLGATLSGPTGVGWLVIFAATLLLRVPLRRLRVTATTNPVAAAQDRAVCGWLMAALALGEALTGNAINARLPAAAVPVVALHLLAFGTLGSVLVLSSGLIPDHSIPTTRTQLQEVGQSAGLAIAVMIATGLGSADLISHRGVLGWSIGYQRLVLVELLVVAVGLIVGLAVWTSAPGSRRSRGIRAELALLAVGAIVAASLVGESPTGPRPQVSRRLDPSQASLIAPGGSP